MTETRRTWLQVAIATTLALEVLRQANWVARMLSLLAIYDGTVLLMVALRAAVTALEASAAWALWRTLPAGPVLGRWALIASALLIVFEIGFGLSPSSITPGLRWIWVVAYGAYAALAITVLRLSAGTDT